MEDIDNFKEKNPKNITIFSNSAALKEAERCLNCKNAPCSKRCPFNINIPAFISEVKNNKVNYAYKVINKSSLFSSICSRVCPASKQCEGGCIRGIKGRPVSISALERYVSQNSSKDFNFNDCGKLSCKKIAVVGSGPAGMSCAIELKKIGYSVTIFEKMPKIGGMLFYGVPEFRLSRNILNEEINKLKKFGIEIKNNVEVGNTIFLKDILKIHGFSAIFLSMGTWNPKMPENLNRKIKKIYSFTDFLVSINSENSQSLYDLNSAKNIAVIGGGNVAIDVARESKRLKSVENVYLVYRRSENELLSGKSEIQHALKENVIFKMLTNAKKIIANDKNLVKEIVCTKNKIIDNLDESGRRAFSEIPNSEFKLKVDAVIFCIGSNASTISDKDPYKKLLYSSENKLKINENGQSEVLPQIFAGGDLVIGPSTVAMAMANGIKIAKNIHKYLSGLL